MQQKRSKPDLDLIKVLLGAEEVGYQERFAIYIPNLDRNRRPIDQEKWVRRAMVLLRDINGGASALPNMLGMYKTRGGANLEEETVLVYSFITDRVKFLKQILTLQAFIFEFGEGADQDRVLVEWDDLTCWIAFEEKPAADTN